MTGTGRRVAIGARMKAATQDSEYARPRYALSGHLAAVAPSAIEQQLRAVRDRSPVVKREASR